MKHTIHEISLNNGARLLAIDVPGAVAASFSVAVRAGFFYAPKSKYELPHLLEHLAFSGNNKYPDLESFMYAIEKTGAWQNASTSPTTIRYYLGAPREELSSVVDMMIPMVSGPLFKPESITRETEVVHAELSRNLESDSFNAAMSNSLTVFPMLKPLEKRLASLNNIIHEDVINYHRRTHGAANMAFVLASDLSNGHLSALQKQLNNHLDAVERGRKLAIPKRQWGDFAGQIKVLKPRAKNQQFFSLSFHTDTDGVADAPALRMFHAAFNKGSGSRLFIRSRQKGLSYGVASGYVADHDNVEFYIDDKTTPEKLLPLFEVCLAELTDMMGGNISDREFERARGFNIGGYELGFQRAADFANWYGQDFVEGQPLESPADYLTRLRAIKKSDLPTVARKYIRPDNWILTLSGRDLEGEKGKFESLLKKYIG